MVRIRMKKYLLFIPCLLLFGCGTPDTSWFPLVDGYWWQYSVTRSIRGESHLQKLVFAMLPTVSIEGTTLYPRKRPDGQVSYYEKKGEAIFLVDVKAGSRTLLLQGPVQVGTTWQEKSKIRFLKVTGAFEATYNRRIKEYIPVDYEIDSVDEIVKVAAGRFTNCIRVQGKGSIYGGGGSLKEFLSIDTINIETVDWYAPGIGLIKRTRKEFTHPLKFENYYSEELEKVRTP